MNVDVFAHERRRGISSDWRSTLPQARLSSSGGPRPPAPGGVRDHDTRPELEARTEPPGVAPEPIRGPL